MSNHNQVTILSNSGAYYVRVGYVDSTQLAIKVSIFQYRSWGDVRRTTDRGVSYYKLIASTIIECQPMHVVLSEVYDRLQEM